MLDGGYPANTMTIMLLLEGCNFKGRGLSEVAMVLYAKLAAAHGGAVPVIVKSQLLQVRSTCCSWRSCSCFAQLEPTDAADRACRPTSWVCRWR